MSNYLFESVPPSLAKTRARSHVPSSLLVLTEDDPFANNVDIRRRLNNILKKKKGLRYSPKKTRCKKKTKRRRKKQKGKSKKRKRRAKGTRKCKKCYLF